jgi:hypothetical protein
MDVKTLAEIAPWEWPRNAAKTLLDALVHRQGDPSDRAIAAELAGNLVVMNNQLASALLAIVRSSEELLDLRVIAAIALGPVLEQASLEEFDDPDSVPITESRFREIQDTFHAQYNLPGVPKELRRRILEASVRSPEPWHPDAIRTAYASSDQEWVLTAVFAMAHIKGFDQQILESLDSPDPSIEYEAVRAASNWALDAAWPHIEALIENPRTSKDLLLAAIEAAPNIRPGEAGPLLVDLNDSGDEEIVEAAEEAIAMAEAALTGGEEELEDDEDEEEGGWVN